MVSIFSLGRLIFILLSCLLTLIYFHSTYAVAAIPTTTVRTVTLRNNNDRFAPPQICLGSEDKLRLNFDIIGNSHKNLKCRLRHLNLDSTPSRLASHEFVSSFNEDYIEDFVYSDNTYTPYVNYNYIFPTDNLSPLVSGNYLIEVFDEENPDSLILSSDFFVSENINPLSATVTTRTDFGFNTKWQQLEIDLDFSNLNVKNPFSDIIITVEQNNRPETMRTLIGPTRIENSHAIFTHIPSLIFPAGNEYRRFETVQDDYPGMNVDSVLINNNTQEVWLKKDFTRNQSSFIYDVTQHGRFLVKKLNATDSDIAADYINVHFFLESEPFSSREVYVIGDFCHNGLSDFNKMTYNHMNGCYEAIILLKQGSYNYQYATLSTLGNTSKADLSCIEGDFYETKNEYLIKAFIRHPSSRYDRLISTLLIDSH